MKKSNLNQPKFESLNFSGIGNLSKVLGGGSTVATGPGNARLPGPGGGQIVSFDSDEYNMDTKSTRYFHFVTDPVLTKEVCR
jgi:hypothetical protein